MERNFRTLKKRWLYGLDISQIQSLEEFNRLLSEYIRRHNTTKHGGTGQNPLERYMASNGRGRRPASREWLDKAFLNRVVRNVNRDATVYLLNECYDVPMQFIGQKVEVRFLPGDTGSAYILYGGQNYPLRCFMNGLNPNQYQTAYISLSTISVTEFYREFCTLLELEASGNKTGMFRAIQEWVYYLYQEKNQPLVLTIDEAQYLNYNILHNLKMLVNHSYNSLNCFSLVLVGEPYLNYILDKQVHEALRQRITVHYNYEGLSDQEVSDYICHKLELAGGSRNILEGGALSAIHSYSEENARNIDNLMTDALTIGVQQDQHCISAEIVMAAANNPTLT